MNFFISLCFAFGAAGFIYSKMGRRLGYSNTQNVWITVGVAFVIAFLVAYSVVAWVLHLN